MKRIGTLALCLLLALSLLAGCGSSPKEAAAPSRGVWTDSSYKNAYAALSLTMPDDWYAATDEEIAAVMGVGAEVMSEAGVEITEEMLALQTITDAMVQNPQTGSNVIIMFENLGLIPGGAKISEKDYLDALAAQVETAGITGYTFSDVYSGDLCGNTYQIVEADASASGFMQYYYARKEGGYMINVLATVAVDDDVANVMGIFS